MFWDRDAVVGSTWPLHLTEKTVCPVASRLLSTRGCSLAAVSEACLTNELPAKALIFEATEAVDRFLPAGEQGGEPWLRFMTTEEAKTQGETQGTRGPAGWETKELTD